MDRPWKRSGKEDVHASCNNMDRPWKPSAKEDVHANCNKKKMERLEKPQDPWIKPRSALKQGAASATTLRMCLYQFLVQTYKNDTSRRFWQERKSESFS